MNREKILDNLFIILLFTSFICSMYPWFIWNSSFPLILIISTSVVAFTALFHYNLINKKSPIIFLTILTCFSLWDSHNKNITGFIFSLFNLFSLITLTLTNSSFKEKLLNVTTKWFSIFLCISLIAYIFFQFNLFPISPTKIQLGNRYPSFNYYLFIIPQLDFFDYMIRFRSIFLEPGHMALGTTMLIMANKFNLKNKYVVILLIVNLFSFSLASYITMFIGFLLYNLSLKKLKKILIAVAILSLSNFALIQFGNGDMLNRYLWDRLEYSEKTGSIEGNQRTTLKYDQVFIETTKHVSLLFLGNNEYDKNDDYGSNAGIKRYIVENGLLGVFLLLAFYLYAPFKFQTKNSIILSTIAILLLFQDSYPFWFCMTIPYITGMEPHCEDKYSKTQNLTDS